MSKRSLLLLPVFLVLSGLLWTPIQAADPPTDTYGARLATYDKATGESYFALSVTPQVRPKASSLQDLVVLVDTSASQRALFRDDSLLAVDALISHLDPHDRVLLCGVDLEAVPMSAGFIGAGSQEMQAARAKLKQRAPLGSTDMIGGLHAAVANFGEPTENSRAIIYIGDGLSRANLFADPEMRKLTEQLVACRASVYSFVIGPERNVAFLAALANQTGGMVFIDSDEEAASQAAGTGLAQAVQQAVLWPQDVRFPPGIVEHYPSVVPPLRTDRDTILIGKLESHAPQQLAMTVLSQRPDD